MLVRYSHNPGSFLERVFNISRTLWTSVVSKNIFLGTSGISTLTIQYMVDLFSSLKYLSYLETFEVQ